MSKCKARWPIFLFGCGALLILLFSVGAFTLHKWKQGLTLGLTDTNVATASALKQLGKIPSGFTVTSSLDLGLAEAISMTQGNPPTRLFVYFRLARDAMNENLRDFFTDETADVSVLQNCGVIIDADAVLSRTTIESNARKILVAHLLGRAQFDGKSPTAARIATFLFECDDDRFHVGVLATQNENDAGKNVSDAELSAMLIDVNPCDRND